MGEIDEKKLEKAIIYLKRITEGKNPINNLPVEEESVLNNPNMIRCMYFVKEVLEEVQKNNGVIGKSNEVYKKRKQEFPIEVLEQFVYQCEKPISKFVEQINAPLDTTIYKKASYKQIIHWLILNNFLYEEFCSKKGKVVKWPTDAGKALGIQVVKVVSQSGKEYETLYYSQAAQEFIIKHFSDIMKL